MNRAARIVSGNFENDVQGVELLNQLGLMTLKEARDYFMGLLVYKCVNGMALSYLCIVLTPASSVQTRASRTSDENLFYIPYVNSIINCDLFKQFLSTYTVCKRSGTLYPVTSRKQQVL